MSGELFKAEEALQVSEQQKNQAYIEKVALLKALEDLKNSLQSLEKEIQTLNEEKNLLFYEAKNVFKRISVLDATLNNNTETEKQFRYEISLLEDNMNLEISQLDKMKFDAQKLANNFENPRASKLIYGEIQELEKQQTSSSKFSKDEYDAISNFLILKREEFDQSRNLYILNERIFKVNIPLTR